MAVPMADLRRRIVAMLVGLLVALPALRVRGVNLAIVTFAFAVAVDSLVFQNENVNGGFKGAPVKAPEWVDPNKSPRHFLGMSVGDHKLPNVSTASFLPRRGRGALLCRRQLASLHHGPADARMRSNERAAAAAGVNVSGTKMLAFSISAFIAGIGGAIIAYRSGNVTPDKFVYTKSLAFFAYAYLGGIASVAGAIAGGLPVAGGLVFTFLESSLHVSKDFELMLAGLGLIITAVQNPEGIVGRLRNDGLRLQAKLRPKRERGAQYSRRARRRDERGHAMTELLHTDDMTVTFGGLRAVDRVDFSVEAASSSG